MLPLRNASELQQLVPATACSHATCNPAARLGPTARITFSPFVPVTSHRDEVPTFADRPARPVQAFVAGFDVGRPGHGRDGNSWADHSPAVTGGAATRAP